MRGISEDYLRSMLVDQSNECVKISLHAVINECKELNPWLPIDENTPNDVELLLYYPARDNDDDFDMPKIQSVGYWSFPLGIWVCDLKYCWGEEKSRLVQPTHYQELPKAPL